MALPPTEQELQLAPLLQEQELQLEADFAYMDADLVRLNEYQEESVELGNEGQYGGAPFAHSFSPSPQYLCAEHDWPFLALLPLPAADLHGFLTGT